LPKYAHQAARTLGTALKTYVDDVRHWRVAPDLKGLFAEARILRDTVLRRLTLAALIPKAQAIVSANIGKLVAAPEYEILLGYPSDEHRILTLLVQSYAAEIGTKLLGQSSPKCRVARCRRSQSLSQNQFFGRDDQAEII
jgi:hypothetical protein